MVSSSRLFIYYIQDVRWGGRGGLDEEGLDEEGPCAESAIAWFKTVVRFSFFLCWVASKHVDGHEEVVPEFLLPNFANHGTDRVLIIKLCHLKTIEE